MGHYLNFDAVRLNAKGAKVIAKFRKEEILRVVCERLCALCVQFLSPIRSFQMGVAVLCRGL